MKSYFYPEDYGACADGNSMNTEALQASIDACNTEGGGVVYCAAGTYRTGSIELKTNVELHVAPGCTLLGSTDLKDYKDLTAEGFKHKAAPEGTALYLIGARNADNIAITGSGDINACGASFFDQTETKQNGKFAKKPAQRPRIVMFHKCRQIRLEGTSFIDSPCWTLWLMRCEQVNIHRIRIFGDKRLMNNDGIDFDACRDVTVSDCIMDTEDDCLVFRAIQQVHDEPAICENIVINNCILTSSCQCVRMSCPSDYITRNCMFSNITMKGRNGINFDFPHTYLIDGMGMADVTDISFSNIRIDCKAYPIRIEVAEGIKLTRIKGISFTNVRSSSIFPCTIRGNPETPIEDVSFNHVQLTTAGDEAIVCAHCTGVKFNNLELNNFAPVAAGSA